MKRRVRKLLLLVLAVAVVAGLGFFAWANTPVGALMLAALAALESDKGVAVARDRWLEFVPRGDMSATGFIFYPGGRVAVEAYAPLGRAMAEAGHLAVLTPMPLNLAILNPAAAGAVMDAYPEIENWVIGGHSLGGVMAARFAFEHPDWVDGLLLLAAYPEDGIDLSGARMAVTTVYGELDGLASVEEIERSFARLPPASEKVMIIGGNHAQFGWYGAQDGDMPAAISHALQNQQVIAATLELVRRAGTSAESVLN